MLNVRFHVYAYKNYETFAVDVANYTLDIIAPPAPQAQDDNVSCAQDGFVDVSILDNDVFSTSSFVNLDSLKLITYPQNGLATVINHGTIRYTASNGFSGVDTFIYEICDYGTPETEPLCSQATVSVSVS